MIDDATNLASGAEVSAEICIVGSGAAGIALAMKLLRTGKRILMLESSARDVKAPDIVLPAFRFPRRYDPVAQVLNEGAGSEGLINFDPQFLKWSRLRAYGGSTNAWGGWTRPLDVIDFDRSDLEPPVAWPISRDAIFPYYYNQAMYLCSMSDIEVTKYDDEAFWLRNVDNIKFLDLIKFSGGAMRNAVLLATNSKSLDFKTVWGPSLQSATNCRILRNVNVRFVVGGPASRSVDHLIASTISHRKRGVDIVVKADQYILATGGTEVARILLNSAPHGFANAYDWLGRCFQIHPLNRSFATYIKGPQSPPQQVINLYSFLNRVPIGRAPPSLLTAFAPTEKYLRDLKVRNFRVLVNMTLGNIELNWEQAPNPESRVMLTKSERDPYFGDPLAYLDWRTLPVDTSDTPNKAMKLIVDILGTLGYASRFLQGGPVITWAGDHHMGATRMSARPEDGYVDINSRVHGVDNLYVASSSVFPTSGYANPTLTIIALAARLGDHLVGRID